MDTETNGRAMPDDLEAELRAHAAGEVRLTPGQATRAADRLRQYRERIAELETALLVCPFDDEAHSQPPDTRCAVCGDYGDRRLPDQPNCVTDLRAALRRQALGAATGNER